MRKLHFNVFSNVLKTYYSLLHISDPNLFRTIIYGKLCLQQTLFKFNLKL